MSMRKVVTINLGGMACQLEEGGYESLRQYLQQAEARLAGNPDRAEILADLEQAIGDKCRAVLGQHKNVVSDAEVTRIIGEMGPVEATETQAAGPVRRLYRIPEKKLLAGVCTGLAAYFGIDVVLVRIVFVVLTLFTGIFALVYLAMMFIVPRADTPAEVAAAHGLPFNARDVLERARKKYQAFRAA